MALQGSGNISMSQIRAELGVTGQTPFSLDSAENGSYATINTNSPFKPSSTNPASISEWYWYCHTCSSDTAMYRPSGAVNGFQSVSAACTARQLGIDFLAGTMHIVSTVAVGNYIYKYGGMSFDTATDKYYYIGGSVNKIITVSSTNYTYIGSGWYIFQISSVSDCPAAYGVDFYAQNGDSTSNSFDLYYQLNNAGNLIYIDSVTNTTCGNLSSITVYDGTVISLYAQLSGEYVYLRGALGGCPANLDVACSYTTTVSAFTSMYVTIYVDGNGDPRYCT